MDAERIARWSSAVGADKAAKAAGISLSTLGRYSSGETTPSGAALITLKIAVDAWEAQQDPTHEEPR